jgi:hypothetical protein
MALYLGYVEKYENLNVKFTLEQALKAQVGSSGIGIALLFL